MKKSIFLLLLTFSLSFSFLAQHENILPENGNVGLGTLTPSAKLDVNGNVHIDSMLLVKDSILIQKDARIKKNLTVEEGVVLKGIFQNTQLGNKQFLMLDENGNIVRGGAADVSAVLGGEMYLEKECGTQLNPTWSNGTNKIFTACPEVNVGINNNTPRVKLDVNGNTYTSRLALGNIDPTFMDEFLHIKSYNNAPSINLLLIENPTKKLLQLDNSGLLKVREVKLDAQNWPDFVFEPNYELRTLSSTETYIKENKHLPDVPDAKTMEKEGVNLAEMDKLLLQKIEELTLYLIEQDKKLEEQKKKIQELELLLQK